MVLFRQVVVREVFPVVFRRLAVDLEVCRWVALHWVVVREAWLRFEACLAGL